MLSCTDQTGRTIQLAHIPSRIISLVPSQTELLHSLGLDEAVCGITKFCVHPEEWFRSKTRIGGTKTVDIEKVLSLNPDLIIANKEENVKEQVEALAAKVPTYVSDVYDRQSALEMISDVGLLTGRAPQAAELVQRISEKFEQLAPLSQPLRALYLIWQEPWMTIGGDTFINEMLRYAGFENVFAQANRYPAVSLEQMQAEKPDVILLSSEPFPFSQKHIAQLQPHFPGTPIVLVDGEMFSWFGSRLLLTPPYFAALRRKLSME